MAEIFNFSTFRKENERSYRSLSYKILLTEGSINSCAFLRKLQKILVFRVIYQKRRLSVSLTSFFTFFSFFKKSPEYLIPFSNFVFYKILCSSNFFGRPSPKSDDLLEVLQVVGLELFYKTCRRFTEKRKRVIEV